MAQLAIVGDFVSVSTIGGAGAPPGAAAAAAASGQFITLGAKTANVTAGQLNVDVWYY